MSSGPIGGRLAIAALGGLLVVAIPAGDAAAAMPSGAETVRVADRDPPRRERREAKPPSTYRYWHREKVRVVPSHRRRVYRKIVVVRPYGHIYPGYGFYHLDADAFKWLAFTAITLRVFDLLSESQQRAHEAAQVRATQSVVGERITWYDRGASGSVMTTRDGESTSGRYCREFQHRVTVGGKTEEAYGTACRQPDGAWEIVSTR